MTCSLVPLGAAALLGWSARVAAHTPFKQWQIYRSRHLIVGTSREDVPTYELGKRLVRGLQESLPESRARVTRARTVRRLASLLSSGQLRLLLLSHADAMAISAGTGPYREFGAIDLRVLAVLGEHHLVSRSDFPMRHAWLLTNTILTNRRLFDGATVPVSSDQKLPVHPGSAAAVRGERIPPPSERPQNGIDATDTPHEHSHRPSH